MAQMDGISKRVIIAIDLDYFFAQCEELRKPEYKDKPLVVCVYSGRTETSGAVSASNYVARKLGVRAGIPIVNAIRLLAKHPEAVFLPVDHEYYDAVSDRVMNVVKSFSPSSPFEQASVDEAYFDVTAQTRGEYGGAFLLAQEIKEEIRKREKLSSTIGVGPNKLIAKMAADSKKPDGLVIIRPEEVREFLKELPVGKMIGVGPKTEVKMNSLGIEKIGELSAFDPAILIQTFGRNLGPLLHRLAQGIDVDPVRERPTEQFSRIITLKSDASDFSFDDDIISIAQDISLRLEQMKQKCRYIGIIAITNELKTKTKARTLAEATDSYQRILDESRELFKELFLTNAGLGIRRVGIRVGGFAGADATRDERKEEGQYSLTSFFPPP